MTIIQIINLILTVLSLIIVICWTVENKKKWRYTYTLILYLVHMLVFYLVLLAEEKGLFFRPFHDFFTWWSSYLRMHFNISVLLSFLVLIEWKKLWIQLKNCKHTSLH